MANQFIWLLVYTCLTQHVNGQDPDLTILVGEWNPQGIFHLSLARSSIRTLPITNIQRPVAIDFDPATSTVYWTDVLLRQIRATHLSGSFDRILLTLNENATLDGLAVDLPNRKLFYTDAGNDVIAVMDIDGSNNRIIKDRDLDQPRAIVLNEEKRKLYWTDWGTKPYIATANYDGTNTRKIVTSGLGWPNGLTLDKKNDILYWCDAQTDRIESVKTDGTLRRLLLSEPLSHFFDIFLSNDALFFTDWTKGAIRTLPVNGGTVGHISSRNMTRLAGIYVFSNINVSDCQNGQFGTNCEDCGHCVNNSVCEKTTGFCTAGCSPGYLGNSCNQECQSGKYGEKCQSVCGNCVGGMCNHVDGRCPLGCIAGWRGFDCKTICPSNTYGSSCHPCGKCINGDTCNIISGTCPNGCQLGFTGTRCDKACAPNTYGQSCTTCGHCSGVSCDRGSGRCPDGCQDGWTGFRCDTRCPAGNYGNQCQSVCGNCIGGGCNNVNGQCSAGCLPGWNGIKCITACPTNTYGTSCVPCGHCANGVACNSASGFCPSGCQAGWSGNKCDAVQAGKTDDSGTISVVAIVGAVVGGVVVLLITVAIVVIAVVVVLRRRKSPTPSRRPKPDTESPYATLDSARQSNIYSVPDDVPPAYSSLSHPSNPRDGYAGLGDSGVCSYAYGHVDLGLPNSYLPTKEENAYSSTRE